MSDILLEKVDSYLNILREGPSLKTYDKAKIRKSSTSTPVQFGNYLDPKVWNTSFGKDGPGGQDSTKGIPVDKINTVNFEIIQPKESLSQTVLYMPSRDICKTQRDPWLKSNELGAVGKLQRNIQIKNLFNPRAQLSFGANQVLDITGCKVEKGRIISVSYIRITNTGEKVEILNDAPSEVFIASAVNLDNYSNQMIRNALKDEARFFLQNLNGNIREINAQGEVIYSTPDAAGAVGTRVEEKIGKNRIAKSEILKFKEADADQANGGSVEETRYKIDLPAGIFTKGDLNTLFNSNIRNYLSKMGYKVSGIKVGENSKIPEIEMIKAGEEAAKKYELSAITGLADQLHEQDPTNINSEIIKLFNDEASMQINAIKQTISKIAEDENKEVNVYNDANVSLLKVAKVTNNIGDLFNKEVQNFLTKNAYAAQSIEVDKANAYLLVKKGDDTLKFDIKDILSKIAPAENAENAENAQANADPKEIASKLLNDQAAALLKGFQGNIAKITGDGVIPVKLSEKLHREKLREEDANITASPIFGDAYKGDKFITIFTPQIQQYLNSLKFKPSEILIQNNKVLISDGSRTLDALDTLAKVTPAQADDFGGLNTLTNEDLTKAMGLIRDELQKFVSKNTAFTENLKNYCDAKLDDISNAKTFKIKVIPGGAKTTKDLSTSANTLKINLSDSQKSQDSYDIIINDIKRMLEADNNTQNNNSRASGKSNTVKSGKNGIKENTSQEVQIRIIAGYAGKTDKEIKKELKNQELSAEDRAAKENEMKNSNFSAEKTKELDSEAQREQEDLKQQIKTDLQALRDNFVSAIGDKISWVDNNMKLGATQASGKVTIIVGPGKDENITVKDLGQGVEADVTFTLSKEVKRSMASAIFNGLNAAANVAKVTSTFRGLSA